MTGYYSGSELGALYYFTQHHRYNLHADHTLVIGPYDDAVMQKERWPRCRAINWIRAALVDLHELRYQWFDHVFTGGTNTASTQEPGQLRGHGRQRVAPRAVARSHGQGVAEILSGRRRIR